MNRTDAQSPTVPRNRPAFTLVELVVVIGIIAVIMSMLIPAVVSIRISARRLQDVSNVRQIALAAMNYANENAGYFPLGDRTGSGLAPANDDLVWINYYTMGYFLKCITGSSVAQSWLAGNPLDEQYRRLMTCNALSNADGYDDFVGDQSYRPSNHGPGASDGGDTYMGYIYWGRRNISCAGPLYDNAGNPVSPAQNYVFPTHLGMQSTSRTLVTCPAWVGPSYGGILLHVGFTDSVLDVPDQWSPANAVSQGMQGIGVAYTDGSARFAPRSDLCAMWQGFEWIYYDPIGP